jgi:hypothetical protein
MSRLKKPVIPRLVRIGARYIRRRDRPLPQSPHSGPDKPEPLPVSSVSVWVGPCPRLILAHPDSGRLGPHRRLPPLAPVRDRARRPDTRPDGVITPRVACKRAMQAPVRPQRSCRHTTARYRLGRGDLRQSGLCKGITNLKASARPETPRGACRAFEVVGTPPIGEPGEASCFVQHTSRCAYGNIAREAGAGGAHRFTLPTLAQDLSPGLRLKPPNTQTWRGCPKG